FRCIRRLALNNGNTRAEPCRIKWMSTIGSFFTPHQTRHKHHDLWQFRMIRQPLAFFLNVYFLKSVDALARPCALPVPA
ncbi:hypothetical protein, partial [Oceanobacter sp. 3_MG-2023]|uniref:hypothetical protein n=1 Tax=Oceanobacter sp. 3_MG-2023 TaxID=3062622 RepID=UPI00273509BB